jgi:hypothetical protein
MNRDDYWLVTDRLVLLVAVVGIAAALIVPRFL